MEENKIDTDEIKTTFLIFQIFAIEGRKVWIVIENATGKVTNKANTIEIMQNNILLYIISMLINEKKQKNYSIDWLLL